MTLSVDLQNLFEIYPWLSDSAKPVVMYSYFPDLQNMTSVNTQAQVTVANVIFTAACKVDLRTRTGRLTLSQALVFLSKAWLHLYALTLHPGTYYRKGTVNHSWLDSFPRCP